MVGTRKVVHLLFDFEHHLRENNIMNIFPLERTPDGLPDPIESARVQCDQHAQKMYLESAQMLSTAHRLLDGVQSKVPSTDKQGNMVYLKSGKLRVKNHWKLADPEMDTGLYLAVHPKHPTTLWTMESGENYDWHYAHFVELLMEFERRHGKMPKTVAMRELLKRRPINIPNVPATPIKLAMAQFPHCVVRDNAGVIDVVESYRNFYIEDKERFATWNKGRSAPEWWVNR
jgi:hypothetical protein